MSETKTENIEGVQVRSSPLPPMTTMDLLPELLEFQGAFTEADSDAAFMREVARLLSSKRLRTLLPRLLASTAVIIPELPQGVMLNSDGNIDIAFAGRMRALPGTVALAVKVSFADFFEGAGHIVKKLQAPSGC